MRPDWRSYIHKIKIKEIDVVNGYLGERRFDAGLELGAGDGFQSNLLIRLCDTLHATEINAERLEEQTFSNPKITFQILDATKLNSVFEKEQFDFIFSSNLLEHIYPNPDLSLQQTNHLLRRDGLSVHIVPNGLWRLAATLLFYPNKFFNLLGRLQRPHTKRRKAFGNNVGKDEKRVVLSRFFPMPHGVSSNIFSEQLLFRRDRWKQVFETNGFDVLEILPGPVCSGYGFGWDRMRRFLEKRGASSLDIFILRKKLK